MPNVQTTPEKFTVEIRVCTKRYSTNTVNISLLWGDPSFTAGIGSFGAQQCHQRRQICWEHPAGQETDTSNHIPLFTKG